MSNVQLDPHEICFLDVFVLIVEKIYVENSECKYYIYKLH